MAALNPSAARQFDDVFDRVAGGHVVASPTAIASGAFGSVTVTVPGVVADGSWESFFETTNAANLNVAGVIIASSVTAANTVVITIYNISGASITPTAGAQYNVIAVHANQRFTL